MCEVLRQVDEQPPGDRDLRRQPRALGADRVLDHLHVSVWPSRIFARSAAAAPRRAVIAARGAVAIDVGDVQEGGALEADLDERGLHSGQHARDPAEVDVADQAALERRARCAAPAPRRSRASRRGFPGVPVDEDFLHRWSASRSWAHGPTSTPAQREQRGRLVQRQTHDAGVAALDPARSRPRRALWIA